jgi:hypothetical protein
MATVSAFTNNNLNGQGFDYLDQEAKYRYAMPLRFTPAVGATLIVIGLVLQSPIWLGSMALVALSGALFPRGMVIDLVYNHGVRHLLHAPPLPPTPRPRQFSYFISTSSLAGAALSFAFGLPALGFVLGGMVAIGATILSTTLWCLGSWIYRMVFRRPLPHRSTAGPLSTVDRGQAPSDGRPSPVAEGGHVIEATPTAVIEQIGTRR